jgi:hypothetical protein
MHQATNQEDNSRYIIEADIAIEKLYKGEKPGEIAVLALLIDLDTGKIPDELYKKC